jgi:hypothetical protein
MRNACKDNHNLRLNLQNAISSHGLANRATPTPALSINTPLPSF